VTSGFLQPVLRTGRKINSSPLSHISLLAMKLKLLGHRRKIGPPILARQVANIGGRQKNNVFGKIFFGNLFFSCNNKIQKIFVWRPPAHRESPGIPAAQSNPVCGIVLN